MNDSDRVRQLERTLKSVQVSLATAKEALNELARRNERQRLYFLGCLLIGAVLGCLIHLLVG